MIPLEKIKRHMLPEEAQALEKYARLVGECIADPLGCEVGSFHGYSTIIIAEHMRLWAIDLGRDLLHGTLSPGSIGKETWLSLVTNLSDRGLIPDRVVPICSTSDYLKVIKEPLFDFIFIDADHSYETCLNDLRNTARLAKPGCVMAVHDVYLGRVMDEGYGVHQAVDTFVSEDKRWTQTDLVITMGFLTNEE